MTTQDKQNYAARVIVEVARRLRDDINNVQLQLLLNAMLRAYQQLYPKR